MNGKMQTVMIPYASMINHKPVKEANAAYQYAHNSRDEEGFVV